MEEQQQAESVAQNASSSTLAGSSPSASSISAPTNVVAQSLEASNMPKEVVQMADTLNLKIASGQVEPGTTTKTINLGIKTVTVERQTIERVLMGTVAATLTINALMLPFLCPKAAKTLGAPFLPTKRVVVDKMFNCVEQHVGPLKGRKLVDLGSGDGRIILKASTHYGMLAKGYELNPYLVLLSKYRCRNAPTASIEWRNLWNNPHVDEGVRSADIVTLYGRPGDKLMEKMAEFLETKTKPECIVVSNVFDIPYWERRLIQDTDGLKVYDKRMQPHLNRELFNPVHHSQSTVDVAHS